MTVKVFLGEMVAFRLIQTIPKIYLMRRLGFFAQFILSAAEGLRMTLV